MKPINPINPKKGFIIAGTQSGAGKTTITLGFLAALTRRGLNVAPFKVGPDFIDPGHHQRVTGRVSRNLDGWMLSKAYNSHGFQRHSKQADITVVEGVMGLFDGYDGRTEAGSTAQMAKWLNLPVILVVNAKSMARSAAALVQGFERFDSELEFAGVIFNNLGSRRHLEYLKAAMEGNVAMPCLGGIVRNDEVSIPERHLGLVTQEDHVLDETSIDRLASLIEDNIDVDAVLDRLPDVDNELVETDTVRQLPAEKTTIGVARDNAFCFYYQDNLDLLEKAGATLVFFSPVSDSRIPDGIDGLYFGGGYPELHVRQLSANTDMLRQISTYSQNGMPIYGECGGFMYLCRRITDQEGQTWPMAGCFPFTSRMLPRLRSLGYREITLGKDTLLGEKGATIRGHEFHYSKIDEHPEAPSTVYRVTDRNHADRATEGYLVKNTLGSYLHLHWGSRPDTAAQFVRACRTYQQQRNEIHET